MADMAPSVGFFPPQTLENVKFQGATAIDTRNVDQKISDHLTMAIPAAAAGFVDTVGQSVGLLDETSMSSTLSQVLPTFGTYYDRNQEGAKLAGDLVGMFVPGMIATKAIRAGSMLHTAVTGLKGGKYLGSVFTSGKSYGQVLEGVKARDMYLANKGVVDLATDVTRKQLARSAMVTKLGDSVKETLAFEAGVLATMNQSEVIYPSDFTVMDHIELGGAVAGVFLGAEAAFMKRAIRASAQEVAPIAHAARDRADMPIEDTIFRPGKRDVGVTQYSLQAAAAEHAKEEVIKTATTPAERELGLSTLNKEAISYNTTIKTQLERMGQDSPYLGVTKRATLSEGEVAGLQNSLAQNPTSLLGTVSAEPLPRTFAETLETMGRRDEHVKKLQSELDAAKANLKGIDPAVLAPQLDVLQSQIDEVGNLQFFVNEADGTIAPARLRKPLFQDGDRRINKTKRTDTEPAIANIEMAADPIYGANKAIIGVTEEMQVVIPEFKAGTFAGMQVGKLMAGENIRPFEQLTLWQRSGVYAATQKMVKDFTPGPEKLLLSEADHHTRLDAVMALYTEHGEQVLQHIQMPQGWKSLEDVEFASLKSKYVEYARLRKVIDKSQGDDAIIKLKNPARLSQYDLVRMLNLPGTQTGDMHPVQKVFEGLYTEGQQTLTIKSMEHFKQAMQEDAFFPEITQFLNKDLQTRGNMLEIPENAKPTLLIKRPVTASDYQKDAILTRASALRQTSLQSLRSADTRGGVLVKALTDDLDSRIEGATGSAMKMETIIEGGQRSKGTFTQQTFAAGEMEALQAAHMTETLTTKKGEKIVGAILEPHVGVFNKIKASNNRADLEALNAYVHARRMGWEVEKDALPEEGKYFFKLRDTKDNQARWQQLFGEAMPKEARMPVASREVMGKRTPLPLALTEIGYQTANSIRQLGEGALGETNAIKHAMGQGQTSKREWWVPAKNLSRQEVVYLVDASGELRSIAHGRTRNEAQAMANQMIEQADAPLMLVDRSDMSRYFSLQDKAFDKMLDFTDPLLQTGKRTGKSVDPGVITTGDDVLNDIINSINKQYQGVIRRTRAAYFEPQLNQARLLYNATGGDARRKGQTAWQMYVNALYGNQNLTKETWTGKVYLGTEEIYDDMINAAHDKLMAIARPSAQTSPKKPVFGVFGEDQEAIFKQMQDKLGAHNPYQDTMDYVNRTYKESFPPSMKQHAAKLNQLTSLLTLRLFEVGHSVLNLTSLAATMPAVIKALKKTDWETAVQHQARIGTFGRSIDGDIGMFDSTRAIASGIHDSFSKPQIWKEAADAGYFKQDVAEMMRTLTEPRQGYAEGLIKKYTDIFSMLSDKSEELSRSIAFMAGHHIAERAGIEEKANRFAFAHKFANDVIGDYRASNRPRIFQGAVGMPLGLFQTFAFNYYQRLFSMIENKQVGALAVQYATQASVFGAQTVPGFKQFNEIFASNYDGTVNPVDGLRNRLGEDGADWFLYGALSNLPKAFGADDGISLTSRGDMAMHRVPGLWNLEQTPAATLVKNTWEAGTKMLEMVKSTGGFNAQQMAEIAANYSIWRAQRNAIELYTGVATDRRGALINSDTQTGISIAARMMGLRPMREAKAMEAQWKIRSTEFAQMELMAQLREGLRAKLRGGTFQDEDAAHAIRTYMKAGGNPSNFANFITQQHIQAKVERSQIELQKAIKDPTRLRDTKRLMELQVLPQNDPYFK